MRAVPGLHGCDFLCDQPLVKAKVLSLSLFLSLSLSYSLSPPSCYRSLTLCALSLPSPSLLQFRFALFSPGRLRRCSEIISKVCGEREKKREKDGEITPLHLSQHIYLSHTLVLSYSLSLSHTHTRLYSLSHTRTHIHMQPHTHTHTHTHTHLGE